MKTFLETASERVAQSGTLRRERYQTEPDHPVAVAALSRDLTDRFGDKVDDLTLVLQDVTDHISGVGDPWTRARFRVQSPAGSVDAHVDVAVNRTGLRENHQAFRLLYSRTGRKLRWYSTGLNTRKIAEVLDGI